MSTIRTRGAGLLAAVALVAGACGPQEGAETDIGEVPPAAEAPAPVEPAGGMLDEAAVVEVLTTANQGEISEAELAQQKATDPEVQQFAQMMIEDHGRLADELANVGVGAATGDTGATPPPEAQPAPPPPTATQGQGAEIVQRLQESSQNAMSELESASGAEFDRAYMERQVEAHQEVLDLLDNQLIPSATTPELRSALENARPVIESHLQQAQQIAERLSGGGAATDTTPSGTGSGSGR